MPKIAYADQIYELNRLAGAVERHRAELPLAGPRADRYRALVERVEELKALQQSCLAGYRTATRKLEAAIDEARYAASSLRGALTADIGPSDARLVEFGIRLRHRRRRASSAGKAAAAAKRATATAEGPVDQAAPISAGDATHAAEPTRGCDALVSSMEAAEKPAAPFSPEAAAHERGRDALGQEDVKAPGGPDALRSASAEEPGRERVASGGYDAPEGPLIEPPGARGDLSAAVTVFPRPLPELSRGPCPRKAPTPELRADRERRHTAPPPRR